MALYTNSLVLKVIICNMVHRTSTPEPISWDFSGNFIVNWSKSNRFVVVQQYSIGIQNLMPTVLNFYRTLAAGKTLTVLSMDIDYILTATFQKSSTNIEFFFIGLQQIEKYSFFKYFQNKGRI